MSEHEPILLWGVTMTDSLPGEIRVSAEGERRRVEAYVANPAEAFKWLVEQEMPADVAMDLLERLPDGERGMALVFGFHQYESWKAWKASRQPRR